jgi:hypothetical protein
MTRHITKTPVSGESAPQFLDAEEFPFSFDEVVDAISLWYPHDEAVAQAEQFQVTSNNFIEVRKADRSRLNLQATPTVPEYGRIRLCSFSQFDWLWPTLSILPSSSERARTWMHFHWRFRFMMLLAGARRRSGEKNGSFKNHDLTPERRHELKETGTIKEFRDFTKENFVLPEATVDNLVEAYRALESEQAAWIALAAEARERLERRMEA